MTQIGCAPTWPLDGPPPEPPLFSLLNSSRVVDDVDDEEVERWANGVAVYPYPPGPAQAWDPYATGSRSVDKTTGDDVEIPKFGPFAVVLGESCTSRGIFGSGFSNEQAQARFVARSMAALAAVEHAGVEAEFMGGDVMGNNPHLADGTGTILNSGSATSIKNAFALLENEIAGTGRRGVIHCSPAAAVAASFGLLIHDDRGPAGLPILRTINGTVVVPGQGYVGISQPDGEAAPGATEEWIYATGPIELRRSAPILLPGSLAEALDRETNTVEYRVERYYVIDWDKQLHAAVLADRCQETC